MAKGSIEGPNLSDCNPQYIDKHSAKWLHVVDIHYHINFGFVHTPNRQSNFKYDTSKKQKDRFQYMASYYNWLNESLKDYDNTPFILLGDFNTEKEDIKDSDGSKFAKCLSRALDPNFVDMYMELNKKWSPTFKIPKSGRLTRIDHIYANKILKNNVNSVEYVEKFEDIVLANIETERSQKAISDHKAVVVDINYF